jgi:hypothetical protein
MAADYSASTYPVAQVPITLEEIEWEQFFKTFNESELAFLYQDEKAAGHPSTFHKFIHRESDEHKEHSKSNGKADHK